MFFLRSAIYLFIFCGFKLERVFYISTQHNLLKSAFGYFASNVFVCFIPKLLVFRWYMFIVSTYFYSDSLNSLLKEKDALNSFYSFPYFSLFDFKKMCLTGKILMLVLLFFFPLCCSEI